MNNPSRRRSLELVGWLALALAMVSLTGACSSFGPVAAATREAVGSMPLSEDLPAEQFVLELESPVLTGVFDVLFVHEAPTMRMQLFPDVGGKVMDLTVDRLGVTARTPTDTYRAETPLDDAEPHLGLALAMMMSEMVAPVTGERLLGQRTESDGSLSVQLLPALGAGRVTAHLGGDGRIDAYHLSLGILQLSLDGSGAFSGRGFSGRITR